jgi:Zn-dependent protease with chaperone function
MTPRTGQAIYFDGVTSARHAVSLDLAPDALLIRDARGATLGRWSYLDLEAYCAPDHLFRIGLRANPVLARLEIDDGDLAHEIDLLAPEIDRTGGAARRDRLRAIGWAGLVALALMASAIYGLPRIADRLVSLVPQALEQRIGLATDAQMRAMLDKGASGRPFVCGEADTEKAGLAAFDKLMLQIEQAAGLPAVTAIVVRREDVNAVALPGGRVYVFQGLIEAARSPDELASVIAHEIGHVIHRDGMRSMLQGAGLSFMFGMMLGDFVGGGAVVLAANSILQSAYSRDVESAADRRSVEIMLKLGADARALGRFLARVDSRGDPNSFQILQKHPAGKERAAAIDAIAPPQSHGVQLLEPAEWAALKRICSGYRN